MSETTEPAGGPAGRPSSLPPELDQHSVRDKVVIVTGAGRGIGRGIARHLGLGGARVVAAEWRTDRLENVTAELTELGVTHLGLECNVMERPSIEAMVAATVAEFGRVDGLVNNAQTFASTKPIAETPEDDLDLLLTSGVKGTLWAMQAVYPHMAAQGWGRIVNFASASGVTGGEGFAAYNASKEAIRALSRTAAREWARHGLCVNVVCPASSGHRKPPGDDEPERKAVWARMYENHPMGRDGDPEHDIAPVVRFLCTDACRYLTGQTLMVDGGGLLFA
jgi:NAD(P)-dependent dehydrogenase (short-subunit alcohol dehydrogenase family)